METVLTGDIGGTNARFALFCDGQYIESSLRVLPVADHSDLADTIAVYLNDAGDTAQSVSRVALSVASTAEYADFMELTNCLLYTSPSPRDGLLSRMPSSA